MTRFLLSTLIARRFAYDLVVPLAATFLLVAAGVYTVTRLTPEISVVAPGVTVVTDPQTFKDVLQTVLAFAGLFITVFGYGAYRVLSAQIEGRIRRNTERQLNIASAVSKTDQGYSYWRQYVQSKDKEVLNWAIETTTAAYVRHAAQLTERESIVCVIRNNLGLLHSGEAQMFRPSSR